MKIFFDTVYYLLITGIVLVALLLSSTFLPIPGNFQIKVVKSGSMEPAIKTGSIVVIRSESVYKVGDIITFGTDSKTQIPTTHRIVAISTDANPVYTTKGDANDAPDPVATHLSDIHGKVLWSAPYLGYILAFARTTLGFALLVGVPALAIILDEIGKIIREVRRLRKPRHTRFQQSHSTYGSNDSSSRKLYINHVPPHYTLRNVVDLRR